MAAASPNGAVESKNAAGPAAAAVKLAAAEKPTNATSARTYVAVDVEKKGNGFAYPVIQVGVAWGTGLGDIATRSFCFDYRSVGFERRCYDEYWSKQLALLARIGREAVEPGQQWPAFVEFWNVTFGADAVIVSDNPAYDLAAIDFHVWEWCRRFPIRNTAVGGYREVHDPSERDHALPSDVRAAIRARAAALAPHDHWAENDAKHILTHYFLVRDEVAAREAVLAQYHAAITEYHVAVAELTEAENMVRNADSLSSIEGFAARTLTVYLTRAPEAAAL